MKTKQQQVIDYMKERVIVRPKDIVAEGLPKDYLYQLAKKGLVVKVRRGQYQLTNSKLNEITEWTSFVEVQRRVPKGVFCLLSALVFHNFTTQNPHDLWIAIANKAWSPNFDYPPVRYIRMSGPALDKYIETHLIEGTELRVYSAAKTVADCFKFRNQIGLDVAIESLKEGWNKRKFSMDELMECAITCRVQKVIQPYAETIAHS
jgi:predicted transcriptional regulator of viral defense system